MHNNEKSGSKVRFDVAFDVAVQTLILILIYISFIRHVLQNDWMTTLNFSAIRISGKNGIRELNASWRLWVHYRRGQGNEGHRTYRVCVNSLLDEARIALPIPEWIPSDKSRSSFLVKITQRYRSQSITLLVYITYHMPTSSPLPLPLHFHSDCPTSASVRAIMLHPTKRNYFPEETFTIHR